MDTILCDVEETKRFAREFLLLRENPRVVQLTARNKYANGELSRSTSIMERTIVRFDKGEDSITSFVKELEKYSILLNAEFYKERKSGKCIRPEWVVPYITVFPLDEEEACDLFAASITKRRQDQRRALVRAVNDRTTTTINIPTLSKIESEWITSLHSSPSGSIRWLKLDVDTKEGNFIERLQKVLASSKTVVVVVVETRGGFHVVVERGKATQGLHAFVKAETDGVAEADKLITIENNKGPMIAIPGTKQGGFLVRLVSDEWKWALDEQDS